MPESRAVVVGGSIASLVAATALARAGRPVRLLLPTRGVGSGFAPLRRDGRTLELGVRALELGREDDTTAVPPLRDYVPAIDGHAPFTTVVSSFVHELAGDRLVELPRPKMVLGGRLVDDILFTVDLTGLRDALGPADADRVAAEARAALDAYGDAGLLAPGAAAQLAESTLTEASLANHGPTFHERVIAPLCAKVLAGGADRVLAALRRKTWAPIFHPRTLWEAASGAPVGFRPHRPFHTVAPDGAGALVDALRARVEADPAIEVEVAGALETLAPGADGALDLRFSEGQSLLAHRPVLGTSLGELVAAAGGHYAPERARTVIAWLEAAEADVEGLPWLTHVLDPANPVLRVSTGGGGAPAGQRLLTVELRQDAAKDDAQELALRGLTEAGLLREGAPVTPVLAAAADTFTTPTEDNRRAFAEARALVDGVGTAELVGGAAGFAADSLNEQIVQGLRIPEVLA